MSLFSLTKSWKSAEITQWRHMSHTVPNRWNLDLRNLLSLSTMKPLSSTLLTLSEENVPVPIDIPHQRPAMRDDVIKCKHFPRYWPFVRGIHRLPVNSPHKGQWRGALMLFLICAWIYGWVNNRETGDLIRHRAHYDVIVMCGKRFHDLPSSLQSKVEATATDNLISPT